MKNSFTTPVKVGHWLAAEGLVFEPTDNMGPVTLENVPVAHEPLTLQLPASPSDGDWFAWSDPLGLVSANYPLTVIGANGQKVNNVTGGFTSTSAHSSGLVFFNTEIDQWCLIAAT